MNKIPTMLNEAYEDFGISKKKIKETISETADIYIHLNHSLKF
jgi:hypothetical protein